MRKQFWELMVKGRLCRVAEDNHGSYEVAIFDPNRQSVERTTMPAGTTLDAAKAAVMKQAAAASPLHIHERPPRTTGRVKWFNAQKGYGFIMRPDSDDLFVHFSTILMDGFKELAVDELVEFEMRPAKSGVQAVNVIRPDAPDSANYRDLLLQREDQLAVAMLDGVIRIVAISPEGNWHFVDRFEHTHGLLHLRTIESRAHRAAVDELEALIHDANVKEQALQEFFERFPEFLLTDEYCRAHSKIRLEADGEDSLIPDFVLEPVGQSRLCDLLELKLPTARIEVLQDRRERFAASVMEACAQLRTYRDYFENKGNRERFRTIYGLEAFRPRMYVVIGRRGEVDPLEWRRIEGDVPALQVRTYDDVLERAKYHLNNYGSLRRTFR